MDQNRLSIISNSGFIIDIDTSNQAELQPHIDSGALAVGEDSDGSFYLLIRTDVRNLFTWGNGRVAYTDRQGVSVRRDLKGIRFGSERSEWLSIADYLPAWMKSTSRMFTGLTKFNLDLSSWNTSNVVDMSRMFSGCHQFNQDMPDWDTRNVLSMNGMFEDAWEFNGSIANWNVSNVERMDRMFQGASSFNQPLNTWIVSKVASFERMFRGAAKFNQPLDRWVTSSATSMESMFFGAVEFDQNLNGWDTSNVTSFREMFRGAVKFNGYIDRWETGNVTNMYSMFQGASSFNQPLNTWEVSKVENMAYMFEGASKFNRSLSNWNTSSLTNISYMFANASEFNGEIENFNIGKVSGIVLNVFDGATSFNQSLNGWDVSSITAFRSMFKGATSFNRPLNGWDLSSATDTGSMFIGATSFNQPLDQWDVSNVEYVDRMFEGATSFNQDLTPWCVELVNPKDLRDFDTGAVSWSKPRPVWGTCGGILRPPVVLIDSASELSGTAPRYGDIEIRTPEGVVIGERGVVRDKWGFKPNPVEAGETAYIYTVMDGVPDSEPVMITGKGIGSPIILVNTPEELSGKGRPGAIIVIRVNGDYNIYDKIGEDGTWSFTPNPVNDDQYGMAWVEVEGGLTSQSVEFDGMNDTGINWKPRPPTVVVNEAGEVSGTSMPYAAIKMSYEGDEWGVDADSSGGWVFHNNPVPVGDTGELVAYFNYPDVSDVVPFDGKMVIPDSPVIEVNTPEELSGTAIPGSMLTLEFDPSNVAFVLIDDSGAWSFKPNPVRVGDTGIVWIEINGEESRKVEFDGVNDGPDYWLPDPPVILINSLDEVSGTAMPYADVVIEHPRFTERTQADEYGNWEFDKNPLPDGEVAKLFASLGYELDSPYVDLIGLRDRPDPPIVLVNNREELSGTALNAQYVDLYVDGDDVAYSEVVDDQWSIIPNPLDSGQSGLLESENEDQMWSKPTPVTAGYIDLYPPIVTVSTVAELSGTAPAGSVVTAVLSGDTLGSVTVGDDNQWSFTPHPFPIGTVGQVYAIDPNTGDESERVDVPGMYKDGESVEPPPPIEPPIDGEVMPPTLSGYTCEWKPRVTLGGVDVSDRLTGRIIVDREESAAGIATFGLFYEPGEAVDPDVAQRAVTVGFLTDTESRLLFSGFVAEPVWDAVSRVLSITATDNLQERVEAMSVEQIDALVGGDWSEQVFGSMDGKSHWDYAQERLSTTLLALDCTTTGDVRVTELNAQNPIYRFKPGTIIYDSLQLDLPRSKTVTNRFEIKTSYRFPRLRQGDYRYYWLHSYTLGSEGMQGFCRWRVNSTELPSQSMVIEATESAGLVPTQVRWISLPMSNPDPCGTQVPWINRFPDLLLGAEWVGSRRWTQYMTEEYELIVTTRFAQENEAQRVINRSSASFDHDTDLAREWSGTLVSLADEQDYEPQDNDDNAERDRMLEVKLKQAQCEIIKAHRASRVTFSVVSCFAGDLDLSNRIEVDDYGVRARGKCFARTDTLDIETGSCVTTLTIALLRGASGAITQPTVPPRLHGEYAPEPVEQLPDLATQIAGDVEYDEELDGFAGNRSISTAPEPFPRRMQLTSPELPEDEQNENVLTGTAVHYVDFKEDELSIQ